MRPFSPPRSLKEMLFDPSAARGKAEAKSAARDAFARVRGWAHELLPPELRESVTRPLAVPGPAALGVPDPAELQVTVREVQCGDPTCAPIDTAVEVGVRSAAPAATRRVAASTPRVCSAAAPDVARPRAAADAPPPYDATPHTHAPTRASHTHPKRSRSCVLLCARLQEFSLPSFVRIAHRVTTALPSRRQTDTRCPRKEKEEEAP